jgi:spermidine/putrescine transport system substrate-binding protein
MHPREGWSEDGTRRRPELGESAISRRQLLGTGAGIAMGALLAGCGGSSSSSSSSSSGSGPLESGGILLPRQNNPVKWPIYSDNKPIASGLAPETGATLQLYNWVAYINEAVIKNFCKLHNCKYQLTTFQNMEEAIAKLGSGQVNFDIFFPTVDVLGQLVQSKMVRALNHSYIPNLTNTWTDYHSPFYDLGAQYTMPYSIYTTGMAWRKDKVNLTPGWDMPWRGSQYKGKVAVLDDDRETLGLALLKAGNLNLNTTNTSQIQAAGSALKQLSSLTNVRIDNNDYTDVPTGKTWIHHAWSGDIASAAAYLPKGTSIDVVGYWFPSDHKGPVANDLMVSLKGGANPVLSHMFINYFLDTHNALENYSYYGYMSPLNGVTPQALISEKLLPPQLSSTVVLPDYFRNGIFELELPQAATLQWETTWNQFSKGL